MRLQLDARRRLQHAARWSQLVECSDEYLCTGGTYRRVSKQAGAFRVDSTFRTCLAHERRSQGRRKRGPGAQPPTPPPTLKLGEAHTVWPLHFLTHKSCCIVLHCCSWTGLVSEFSVQCGRLRRITWLSCSRYGNTNFPVGN